MDRRTLVKGLAVAAALALAGCSSPPLGARPQTLEQALPLIQDIYPDVANDFVLTSGKFMTGSVPTDWYNLTPLQYQPTTSLEIFNYFYHLADIQTTLSHPLQGQQTPFRLSRRNTNERIILFVPQEAAPPPWPGIDPSLNIGLSAATLYLTDRQRRTIAVTYIAVPNSNQDVENNLVFNTQQLVVSKSFAVEACQSSISVGSTDAQKSKIGQELVCNSIGAALALKSGHSYQEFLTWLNAAPYYLDPQTRIPSIIVPEDEFNRMPVVKPYLYS